MSKSNLSYRDSALSRKAIRAKSSAISRISLILHAIWFAIFGYIAGVNMNLWPRIECPICGEDGDSIGVAAELGRLDVVSISLAILGVTLAVAALAGFQVVRSAAMDAARDEARDRLSDMLPKLLTAAIVANALKENPSIYLSVVGQIRETIRSQGANDIDDSDADLIAGAVDEDTGI